MSKKRVTRNTTVAQLEAIYNMPEGTVRKLSGANARGDMKLGTLAWSLVLSWKQQLEDMSKPPEACYEPVNE